MFENLRKPIDFTVSNSIINLDIFKEQKENIPMNKRENGVFIVKGFSAAVLDAEKHIASVRPGGKRIPPVISVDWEDATEEQQKDPHILWFTENLSGNTKKYFFRRHTTEEKQEIELNTQWRIREIIQYLLDKYGWEYATKYANREKDKIEKFGIKIDLTIPHCEYNKDNQCDMFCPFFKGHCEYYKEEN